jgi:CTP synthase
MIEIDHCTQTTTIGVVGKYVQLKDSYKSLAEALEHGGIANQTRVKIKWIDCQSANLVDLLADCDGVLVPGGFGARGIEGKLQAITHARTTNKPFLGICLGMQLAVIDAMRFAGRPDANSAEFGDGDPIMVDIMPGKDGDMGGTMRLGLYPARVVPGSLAHTIYGSTMIQERHRHRYEIAAHSDHNERLAVNGMTYSGTSPDGHLVEIVERPDHDWFLGVQFHPELLSKPLYPHPIFVDYIRACKKTKSNTHESY